MRRRRLLRLVLLAAIAASFLLAPSSSSSRRPSPGGTLVPMPSYLAPLVGPRELDIPGVFEDFPAPQSTSNLQWAWTVPSSEYWLVRGLDFEFITDANVQNRLLDLQYVLRPGGATETIEIPAPGVQTASSTCIYHFDTNTTNFANGVRAMAIQLPEILLPPQTSIIIQAISGVGTDKFIQSSSPLLRVDRFPQRRSNAVAPALIATPLPV